MKMKYILIFSLFLLGCASGSKQQKMSLEKIEESSVDSLVLHPVPGMELWCSDGLSVCDSCLLILDRCQDKKLYVYRLNDFKCVANIGTVGQGPEDMIFPFFLHNNISSSNQQTIYDVNMARIKTIDIHSLLSGSKEIIKQNIPLPAEVIGSTDMSQIGDSYYGTKDSNEGLFFIYSQTDSIMKWIPYPKSVQPSEGNKLTTVGQSRITVHLNQKLVAVAMRYYNQIFLYDNKGEFLKGVTLGKEVEPVYESPEKLSTLSELFFSQISSTDNYIYLVTANQYYKDTRPASQRPRDIVVFDWELNHVKTFKTNKCIQQLIVDPVYRRLLLLCINDEEEPELYYTDFQESQLI